MSYSFSDIRRTYTGTTTGHIRIPRANHRPRIEWAYRTREQFQVGLAILKPLRDHGALDYWQEQRGSMPVLVIVIYPESSIWTG